ncbi:MAG: methionine adenosyltransferase [bacterium]|nr:methionine adenosyltransferase [bacterium]
MLNRRNFVFTSESVSEGHPDKVCDQISDALLDLYLTKDPFARVAIETAVGPNTVVLLGETRSVEHVSGKEIEETVRQVIKDIGYDQEGFHWESLQIQNHIHRQSEDIALGVDQEGAGDQGLMFGYACDETEAFLPAPIYYSHRILEALALARKTSAIEGLGPDAKCQLTLQYEDGVPQRVTTLVLSTQHRQEFSSKDLEKTLLPFMKNILPEGWLTPQTRVLINPTGRFVVGGPVGDSGLTGRKIIVDTYGGAVAHGGGAFSGKDPTKVDRSAAYMARFLALNVVAAGVAKRCTIQLAYSICVAEPVSFYLNTHGTGTVSDEELEKVLPTLVDLTPKGIAEALQLNRPIYKITAAYGHFGRSFSSKTGNFPWENPSLKEKLLSSFPVPYANCA